VGARASLRTIQSVTIDWQVSGRKRLAHFKCPAAVEFGNLPKTSTGKVQKYVLREKEWAGHAKRIH
jgi:acyl-CoA synthetase (AMP-forming)/AMP-acid ligase II